MGAVNPTNTEVLEFKGLHLYHARVSNCSMRVRMVLEEKGLPWTSHHLDLYKKEHITPEYFGINPNGVVPTLVHDGVVIIESDDIIDYIDQTFPDPPLRPSSPENLEKMYWWMKSAIEIHVKAVKTFFYYNKVQGKMEQSDEQKAAYEKLQTNEELLAFHKRSSEGFSKEEVKAAELTLDRFFDEANERLKNHEWLVGDQFTLADITWLPLHFTLVEAGYHFNDYPEVEGWAKRIAEKDCFKKGVLEWRPDF